MNFRGKELADAYQAKRDVEEKEKVSTLTDIPTPSPPPLLPRPIVLELHRRGSFRNIELDFGLGIVRLCVPLSGVLSLEACPVWSLRGSMHIFIFWAVVPVDRRELSSFFCTW